MSAHLLQDTVWQLSTLNNAPAQTTAPATIMMLDTRKKSLLGMCGDMRFRAQYEVNGDQLHFTQVATNRQSPDIGPFEATLLNALSQTSSWRIAPDGTLTLLNQGAVLATFIVAGK